MKKTPLFSVIVPTRDRPQAMRMCLESLARLDFPPQAWELIVVNDGGGNPFAATPAGIMRQLDLHILHISHSGPAHARNVGATKARGVYLAFTDDDCCVEPDWLEKFSVKFENSKWDALGGRCLNPYTDSPVADAWHSMVDFLYGYFSDHRGNALQLVSNNMACRRSVYRALGGFNAACRFAGGEDTEFSYRMIANGFRQCYYPEALSWHYQLDLSLMSYVRQQFRYGRGYFYTVQTRKNNSDSETAAFWYDYDSNYRKSVAKSLLKRKESLSVRALVFLSQFLMHPSGLLYQTLRSLKPPAGARISHGKRAGICGKDG